jgi:hypothetical protein
LSFIDPVHLAAMFRTSNQGLRAETERRKRVVEELPRQIVLAVPPSGNFRATGIFEWVSTPSVISRLWD